MTGINNCPRCFLEIKPERLQDNPVICDSCGHVLSPLQSSIEAKMERRFLIWIISFSVVMVLGFMHLANWGSASLEVLGFQATELVSGNSHESVERMAAICLELKKYDCTEKMYARNAPLDPTYHVRLGKFQVSQRKFPEAVATFKKFFADGGGDIDANYLYAKALSEIGEIDEASKHFEFVLEAKPDTLQITVVQNYVKYLVEADRLDQAKQVIERMQRRDQTVSSFMDSELKEILQRMGSA